MADLLEDGVSSVKGYVYEPYLTAVGSPSVLLDAYATGYSMAEAHAMANTQIGWMGVVVGDPKMAPYADRFHDIRLVDVRSVGNVTYLRWEGPGPEALQRLPSGFLFTGSNGRFCPAGLWIGRATPDRFDRNLLEVRAPTASGPRAVEVLVEEGGR